MFFLAAGMLVGLAGCDKGTDLPNDPLPVLVCDEGYVIDGGRTGCIPVDSVLVHGVVRDDISERPLAGVQVLVHPWDSSESLVTDANGYFRATGVPTTDDVIVTFNHADYFSATVHLGEGEDDGTDVGHVVLDASTYLRPLGRPTLVAGTVYAGDAPAEGASIILYNDTYDYEELTTTTDASGGFTFADVPSDTYILRVLPFDEDGDGISDYHYHATDLGHIGTPSGYNMSNLVIGLSAITKSILFTNFIPAPSSGTMFSGATIQNIRLASATSNILLHFGAEVNTDTVQLALYHYSSAAPTNDQYGDSIPITATWSNGDTVLTAAPTDSGDWLTADSNPHSQYAFFIDALVWADGSVFISQTSPTADLEFRFDVSDGAPVLTSPVPDFFVSRRNSQALHDQVADQVSCDAWQCWVLDADDYYFNGWQGIPSTQPNTIGYFNSSRGFDIKWPAVTGASSYNVYARRRSTSNSGSDLGTWYAVNASLDITPTYDPVFGPEIDAVILNSNWTGDLNPDSIGPLGGSAEVDIVVTSEDRDGFESPIEPANALTISDTMAAAAYNITVSSSSVEYGSSRIKRDIAIDFSEYMDTQGTPTLQALGGNIIELTGPREARWERSYVSPENVGDQVTLVEQELRIRGTCSPITCPAATDQNSVCVADASLFSSANWAFFITPNGGLAHVRQSISSISGDIVTFGSNFTAALSPTSNHLACATEGTAGSFTTVQTTVGTGTTIEVGDASMFYVGSRVAIYDVDDSYQTALVAGVRATAGTHEIDLDAVLGDTFEAGSAVIPVPPGSSEYNLRPAEEISLRHDLNVDAATMTVEMGSDLQSTSVMVGDTCLVDVDGDITRTIGDRYLATVEEVAMDPGAATPIWSLDLNGLPVGTFLVRNVSTVICLGDGLTISNAAELSDTSGNTGLQPFADQMSSCSGSSWGCGHFSTGKLIY